VCRTFNYSPVKNFFFDEREKTKQNKTKKKPSEKDVLMDEFPIYTHPSTPYGERKR
jgi:hypothetical protein